MFEVGEYNFISLFFINYVECLLSKLACKFYPLQRECNLRVSLPSSVYSCDLGRALLVSTQSIDLSSFMGS